MFGSKVVRIVSELVSYSIDIIHVPCIISMIIVKLNYLWKKSKVYTHNLYWAWHMAWLQWGRVSRQTKNNMSSILPQHVQELSLEINTSGDLKPPLKISVKLKKWLRYNMICKWQTII